MGSVLNNAYQKHKNLPPGPIPFPVVGNLPQIIMRRRKHKRNYDMFQELRHEYGDLFRVNMGSNPMVFVFGSKYIREVLVEKGQYFINRSQTELARKMAGGKGIIFTNGHPWKEMRRFALMTMRDFGLGKKSLESRVQDEVKIIIEEFAGQKGAFFPKRMYLNAISNNICALVFGQRYEYTDPELQKVLDVLDYLGQNAGAEMPENFLPFLTHVPGYPSKIRQIVANNLIMRDFILAKLDEHRETFDPKDIRDFMDLYIDIEVNGSTNEVLSDENMFRVIMDIFSAGTETTATTMTWVTLFVSTHPHVLQKCQEEVDRIVGQGRMVNLVDKPNMPYMMATIHEAQRLASVVPASLPRETTADVQVGRHLLPQGTMIMPYSASVHWDPDLFPEPMAYKPDIQVEMPDKRLQASGLAEAGPTKRIGVEARHPVEKLLLNDVRRSEQQEMMTKALVFGQHAPIRAKMERNLLAQFQRLPGLQSSLVGLETLLDMDDTIEFEDIFNLEDNSAMPKTTGPNRSLHDVMEHRLNMRF